MSDVVKMIVALTIYAIINTVYIRYLNIMGVMPNINAIIVVLIGLNMGMTKGAYYGLYLGLFADIITGTSIGLNALIYMYVGYTSGALAKKMYNENVFISALAVTLADIFYDVVIYATYYLPKDYDLVKYSIKILLPEVAYTLGVFLFVYVFLASTRRQVRRGF